VGGVKKKEIEGRRWGRQNDEGKQKIELLHYFCNSSFTVKT
jgi:hypothetical protein